VAERPTTTSLACQSASVPVAEVVGATVSTRIAALAWDGYGPASPTAKIECDPSAGRGSAIETVALPLPSAAVGDPLSVAPDVESSSRYVTPSFDANPVSDPVSAAGLEPPPNAASPRIDWSRLRLAAPIVTVPLLTLSRPRQSVPITGVIVYCQLPNGTAVSVQLRAVTTPLQPANVIWGA
jgi:hypothetical protein